MVKRKVRRTRVSLSRSELSHPESPIQLLATRLQDYLYFPDPSPLYVLMGAVAANCMSGNPVWLMLIGPPSCGGTLLLLTLMGMEGVFPAGSITGPAALLSGTGRKEVAKDASGGLFKSVEPKGMLVFKDFTSILSLPREPMTLVLDAFRNAYDGSWSRPVGTDGAKVLEWKGKMAVMGKCTPAIDAHHSITANLGERWIYYRYPVSDGYGECRAALDVENPERAGEELRGIVRAFFEGLGLGFGKQDRELGKRNLEENEISRLYAIAAFAAKARSGTSRDGYSREVVDVSESEIPTRLVQTLGQLYLGMEIIGLGKKQRWRLIGKVALDSMPNIRRKTIELITKIDDSGNVDSTRAWKGITPAMLCESTGVSLSTARRSIEDLKIHGIVEQLGGVYRLSEWAQRHYLRGWAGKED